MGWEIDPIWLAHIFQLGGSTASTNDIFRFFDRFPRIVCSGVLGYFLYMECFFERLSGFVSMFLLRPNVNFSTAKDHLHVQISLACSSRPNLDEFGEIASAESWTIFSQQKNIWWFWRTKETPPGKLRPQETWVFPKIVVPPNHPF